MFFSNKSREEGNWSAEKEVNGMRNEMVRPIIKVANGVLGVIREKCQ
jgi:hypothetical protein